MSKPLSATAASTQPALGPAFAPPHREEKDTTGEVIANESDLRKPAKGVPSVPVPTGVGKTGAAAPAPPASAPKSPPVPVAGGTSASGASTED